MLNALLSVFSNSVYIFLVLLHVQPFEYSLGTAQVPTVDETLTNALVQMHGCTQKHLPFSLNCPQLSQQPVLVQNHPGEIILTPEETRRVIKYFLNLDSNQKIQHVSAS